MDDPEHRAAAPARTARRRAVAAWVILGLVVTAVIASLAAAAALSDLSLASFGRLMLPSHSSARSSPRWRGLAWLSAATMAACWAMMVLTPGTFVDVGFPSVDNPFARSAFGAVTPVVLPWLLALLPVCIIGCAVSLALRYRSAHGVQRLQLKWLAAAACTAARCTS